VNGADSPPLAAADAPAAAARRQRRRAQWAWALTACANHSFATTVLVGFFPILLGKYWAANVPGTTSTFYLGVTNSSASLIVMLCAPWLGALADRRGQKKRWLGLCTALGAGATLLLAGVGAGAWPAALALFALASIGFYAGSSFQDALIVQVADAHESNRVSAFGFAAGYLGGGLLFLFNVVMVLHPAWFGIADATAASRIAFVDVAAWWVVFTLPLFRSVPEAPPTAEPAGWRELRATLRHVLADRAVRRFLIAYWLYIDAIGTVQQMAVDFGSKLGFSTGALIQALLLVQFIAFPFALLFGKLADRIGTRPAIQLGLVVFLFVTVFAYFMHSEREFYLLAALVGTVQGGVQALSRSYFARLIPRERAGEYFGFYNMLGKFAAVLGPLLVGAVALATRNQRASILSLSLFFVAGMWLLARSGGGLRSERTRR
jgi:UMF1 family MFS transporter